MLSMFTPWRAVASWWSDAPSDNASGLVVLTLFLAIAAALLPRLGRAGIATLQKWPERAVRLALLVPLGLTVVVAVFQHLRQTHSLGPGVLLAVCAALVVAGMDARPAELERWRIAAIIALGLGVALTLWGVRGVFGAGAFGFYLLVAVVWLWAFAAWYALALHRRNATDWLAMVLVGGLLLLAVGVSSTVGAGASGLAVTLIMAGVTMGATEGMHTRMGLPAESAQRWTGLAASLLTVWAGAAGYVALLGIAGLIASGSGAPGSSIWLTLLGAGMATAAGYARKALLEDPGRGRRVALGVAGGAALLWLLTLLVSDQQYGITSFFGLVLPAAVAGTLLLPPSVAQGLGQRGAPTPEPAPGSSQGAEPVASHPTDATGSQHGSTSTEEVSVGQASVGQATQDTSRASAGAAAVTSWLKDVTASPGDAALASATPGTPGVRLAARLIDGVLLGLVYVVLSAVGVMSATASVDPSTGQLNGGGLAGFFLVLLLLLVVGVLYEIALVATTGATVGKHLMKLRVTTMDGTTPTGWGPSARRFFLPSVAGLVPFGSVVVLGSVFFDNSGLYRGWHDTFANTRVVSVR